MGLKETIDQEIRKAMLEKRKEELLALRSIKSAILLAKTEKSAGAELSVDVEIKLLTKAAKQRKDSADLYLKEGRNDLADKELFELEVINRFLPKQLTEEEIRAEVMKIMEAVNASGPQDMGKVMGVATKELAGKADGKTISFIVKELLSK
ncbi:Transamidase GatB domain protein [Fulvivirga imtechensis AK7]|uniref:Transamidase GatB domain protein n=1 Tax=Fulvivirga imtechensis AK7 TaxID=1237149 RepID=L8JRA1_9BACT|nr:GatB/YqeY domain-containing protein [Fulvivirga imtechensis]ELR71390.1 Transamidase GatB domain protein [Fulvivirga imtechensis AK7]